MPGCSNCTGNLCKDNNCTRKQSGGLKKTFYLANRCEVLEYVLDPDTKVITDITFVAGAGWYKVTTIKDTSSAVEDLVAGVLTFNQTVTLTITNFTNNADNAVAWMEAKQFAENWINAEDGIILLAELRSPSLPAATYVLYGQRSWFRNYSGSKNYWCSYWRSSCNYFNFHCWRRSVSFYSRSCLCRYFTFSMLLRLY